MRAVLFVSPWFLCLLAFPSCAPAPAKVYSEITSVDNSQVVREFAEVIRMPATKLMIDKKLKGELGTGDPIVEIRNTGARWAARAESEPESLPPTVLRVQPVEKPKEDDPALLVRSAHSTMGAAREADVDFRTHFDLFRISITQPGDYEIRVEPKKKGNGYRATAINPIVRVLTAQGEILCEGIQRSETVQHFPGIPEAVVNRHLDPGEYVVFVGADNASPGTLLGYFWAYVGGVSGPNGVMIGGSNEPFDVTSSGKGAYTIQFKPQKKVREAS